MPCTRVRIGSNTTGIICWNPQYRLKCRGRWVDFEWTYFGPIPIKKNGYEYRRVPGGFWEAAERWAKRHPKEAK